MRQSVPSRRSKRSCTTTPSLPASFENCCRTRTMQGLQNRLVLRHSGTPVQQSHRFLFLTWGKTPRCWHTMTPCFKKRIGRRFKASMSLPREQILRKCPLFPQRAIANLIFSKIGKYGVGFRACYHVRWSVLLFATDMNAILGHRWTSNPFRVVICNP